MPRSEPSNPAKKQAALDRAGKERRMLLALAELHSRTNTTSARQLAIKYNISATQLSRRFKGTSQSRVESREGQQRLSIRQETILAEHVQVACAQWRPLRRDEVVYIANHTLREADDIVTPAPIGKCWIGGFLMRHPKVRSAMGVSTTRTPSERVQDAIHRHKISSKRVYSMDETVFALDTDPDTNLDPPAIPMLDDSITVIETICNDAQIPLPLPPLTIVTDTQLNEDDLDPEADYQDATVFNNPFGSHNGFTIMEWLKIFHEHTSTSACASASGDTSMADAEIEEDVDSEWRLAILMDTPGMRTFFDIEAWTWAYEHHISIVMLPASESLVDTAVFRTFEEVYKRRPQDISSLNWAEFTVIYCNVRRQITSRHVRHAFAQFGVPLSSDDDDADDRPSTPERDAPLDTARSGQVRTPRSQEEFRAMLEEPTPMDIRLAAVRRRKMLKYVDAVYAHSEYIARKLRRIEALEEAEERESDGMC